MRVGVCKNHQKLGEMQFIAFARIVRTKCHTAPNPHVFSLAVSHFPSVSNSRDHFVCAVCVHCAWASQILLTVTTHAVGVYNAIN